MNKHNNPQQMTLKEAQEDMCLAYLRGGTGVLASGIVWLTAGILALYVSKNMCILAFFLGGMLIHPAGLVLVKLFGRTGKHSKDNPLGILALESTAILFVGLFIAYLVFQIAPDWFFSIMLLMIGVRYLVFQSIYGLKLFWALGLALMIAGTMCLVSNQPFQIPAIIGGGIELIFAVLLIQSGRKAVD